MGFFPPESVCRMCWSSKPSKFLHQSSSCLLEVSLSYCFLQVPNAYEKEGSELTCFYPSLIMPLCVCHFFKSSNLI